MKIRKKVPQKRLGQKGYTLLEIMVSTGLVGIIFFVLLTMFGQVGTFAGMFYGQGKAIEGVSEAVAILNSVLSQATRIEECKCRSNSSTRADCVWEAGANAWYDPVINGGASSGVTILRGEFEAYDGTQSLTSMAGLDKPASYRGFTCAAHESNLASTRQRGCRHTFELQYTPPTQATGTPSNAGQLALIIGGNTTSPITIGQADWDGANGMGVTELACGFDNSSGALSGTNFVLNMRVKVKKNTVRSTSHPNYESWYPGRTAAAQSVLATKNYLQGQFREIRLKFAMKNMSTRGLYSWRPQAIRNCVPNGAATYRGSNGQVENVTSYTQCCSQAWTQTSHTCIACVRAGQSATSDENSCCSGQKTGSVCI